VIPVIDIFAGPGGLGEGFSAFTYGSGETAFKIRLSLEKEEHAHQTLRLRAFYRQFAKGKVPEEYYKVLQRKITIPELFALKRYDKEAKAADSEARQFTLGEDTWGDAEVLIRTALKGTREWLLIGGPPCQAYSLVGRSRNKGKAGYQASDDHRHFLYREYLRIVGTFKPSVFVMENVKGLLSSQPEGSPIFEEIKRDLQSPIEAMATSKTPISGKPVKYRLYSLAESEDQGKTTFVLKAERYGIPQARHRVIVVGVREDLGDVKPECLKAADPVAVEKVLDGLPSLRSGISRVKKEDETPEAWQKLICGAVQRRWFQTALNRTPEMEKHLNLAIQNVTKPKYGRGGEFLTYKASIGYKEREDWFLDHCVEGICNHASRAHIEKDLYRYFFAACFAKAEKCSPVLSNFPADLVPNHANASTAIAEGNLFEDRFRVQVAGRPATTVTSHIAKDGHYYIHPDPTQCRSFTVREAARVQTFPDNYLFTGPRTAQYTQVGNAVPPLLATQIARVIFDLFQKAGIIPDGPTR
jgi:DNA (cytosine-5)-methyltransferase 1